MAAYRFDEMAVGIAKLLSEKEAFLGFGFIRRDSARDRLAKVLVRQKKEAFLATRNLN